MLITAAENGLPFSTRSPSLEEQSTHDLIVVDDNPKNISLIRGNAGKSVELEGYKIDNQFCIKSLRKIQKKTELNAPQPVEGIRRALVLIASRTPGGSVSETFRNDIKKIIDAPSQNANSVNNTYRQSSYGRLGFTADVVGPFFVQSSGCSWESDLAAAKAAAQSGYVRKLL